MQYNIYLGGGFSKGNCLAQRKSHYNGIYADTSDQIIQLIEVADPDILVFNEFCYIGYHPDTIGKEVANRIIMPNYYLGEDYFSDEPLFPSAIFTKDGFDIIESKSLLFSDDRTIEVDEEIFRGLYASVQTPGGNNINIFGVHLTPFCGNEDREIGKTWCLGKELQVEWLIDYIGDTPNAILTGDFNFLKNSEWAFMIYQKGWKIQPQSTVYRWIIPLDGYSTQGDPHVADHAFIQEVSNLRFIPFSKEELKEFELLASTFQQASDHDPNLFQIGIYPP
jgi:hypothetical protein